MQLGIDLVCYLFIANQFECCEIPYVFYWRWSVLKTLNLTAQTWTEWETRMLHSCFNIIFIWVFFINQHHSRSSITDCWFGCRPKKWEGVDTTPYCSSAGFNASSPILSEVSSALLALGIDIEQVHEGLYCSCGLQNFLSSKFLNLFQLSQTRASQKTSA